MKILLTERESAIIFRALLRLETSIIGTEQRGGVHNSGFKSDDVSDLLRKIGLARTEAFS